MASSAGTTAIAVFTARATRSAFRRPWVIALFFLIAGTYAFASMLLGSMLVFARTGASSVSVWFITAGAPWWNYPALLVVFPGGSLALPFFPTISMVVVSIGVGIGMSVAAVIAARLLVLRRASAGRPLAAGSVAGLTPALLALVTMGACCTTTAASAAGLGVVAQTTGTSIGTLLANNWYLGVFQMLVVLVALLAQEAVLVAYGPFLGLSQRPGGGMERPLVEPAPLRMRDLWAAAVRVALIGGAALWSLWAFADVFSSSGGLTTPAAWFGFLVIHQFAAGLIIAVALFPRAFRATLVGPGRRSATTGLRGVLLVLGVLILTWIPPLWASPMTAGLANQVLGLVGAPVAWGAVAPPFSGQVAIALQILLGFVLLGSSAILLALRPGPTLNQLDPAAPAGISVSPSNATVAGGGSTVATAGAAQASPREPILNGAPTFETRSCQPPSVSDSAPAETGLRLGDTDGP